MYTFYTNFILCIRFDIYTHELEKDVYICIYIYIVFCVLDNQTLF